MNPRVTFVTLAVADLDRALAFYLDGLGFEGRSSRSEDHAAIHFEDGFSLALYEHREFATFAGPAMGAGGARVCLSHLASSAHEVDELLAKALAAGGTVPTSAREFGWGYSGYFTDPDDHLWEIVHFAEE